MTSLRRADLLTLSNLRNDGRKPNELRRMTIQMSPMDTTATCGSALVQMGITTVLAYVDGPMDCARRADELTDRAILEVNVSTAPFAPSSGDRRTSNSSTDRRLIEQSSLLQKALEASVLLHLHPKTRVVVNVRVFADDGGRLCAAINAATLALVDAGIAMRDLVCACAVGSTDIGFQSIGGVEDDTDEDDVEDIESNDIPILLDLNSQEISGGFQSSGGAAAYLLCATMPQRNTLVLSQCESRLPSIKVFERMLATGMDGCEEVFHIMRASLKERVGIVSAARRGTARIHLGMDQRDYSNKM
mmetsp:Transcript_5422/g.7889  ORF Transcript_5422/g.7889 Transcript_5422/m.7889 type:complete len:303 (+) Transcript_5422:177-1085(+)|eukprot:CAMPEP_0184871726 /NCGR_PEP_ID=MMETSP0580-20130426/40884_1 /TAXON_ID=1118495 /ORGANISM="Dactyliosolen fragilissimus" /LENGTH=302 /DNA_ID=CAMNT_0027374425 /DNA_START=140 /DNA_END=1048 /DNA_ORIENTATION=+